MACVHDQTYRKLRNRRAQATTSQIIAASEVHCISADTDEATPENERNLMRHTWLTVNACVHHQTYRKLRNRRAQATTSQIIAASEVHCISADTDEATPENERNLMRHTWLTANACVHHQTYRKLRNRRAQATTSQIIAASEVHCISADTDEATPENERNLMRHTWLTVNACVHHQTYRKLRNRRAQATTSQIIAASEVHCISANTDEVTPENERNLMRHTWLTVNACVHHQTYRKLRNRRAQATTSQIIAASEVHCISADTDEATPENERNLMRHTWLTVNACVHHQTYRKLRNRRAQATTSQIIAASEVHCISADTDEATPENERNLMRHTWLTANACVHHQTYRKLRNRRAQATTSQIIAASEVHCISADTDEATPENERNLMRHTWLTANACVHHQTYRKLRNRRAQATTSQIIAASEVHCISANTDEVTPENKRNLMRHTWLTVNACVHHQTYRKLRNRRAQATTSQIIATSEVHCISADTDEATPENERNLMRHTWLTVNACVHHQTYRKLRNRRAQATTSQIIAASEVHCISADTDEATPENERNLMRHTRLTVNACVHHQTYRKLRNRRAQATTSQIIAASEVHCISADTDEATPENERNLMRHTWLTVNACVHHQTYRKLRNRRAQATTSQIIAASEVHCISADTDEATPENERNLMRHTWLTANACVHHQTYRKLRNRRAQATTSQIIAASEVHCISANTDEVTPENERNLMRHTWLTFNACVHHQTYRKLRNRRAQATTSQIIATSEVHCISADTDEATPENERNLMRHTWLTVNACVHHQTYRKLRNRRAQATTSQIIAASEVHCISADTDEATPENERNLMRHTRLTVNACVHHQTYRKLRNRRAQATTSQIIAASEVHCISADTDEATPENERNLMRHTWLTVNACVHHQTYRKLRNRRAQATTSQIIAASEVHCISADTDEATPENERNLMRHTRLTVNACVHHQTYRKLRNRRAQAYGSFQGRPSHGQEIKDCKRCRPELRLIVQFDRTRLLVLTEAVAQPKNV
jgi:uncharacterized protein (DUF1330 family)